MMWHIRCRREVSFLKGSGKADTHRGGGRAHGSVHTTHDPCYPPAVSRHSCTLMPRSTAGFWGGCIVLVTGTSRDS